VPWARKEIENSLKEGDKSAAAAASAADALAASDKEIQPDASASDDKTESNKAKNTKVIEHWATKIMKYKFLISLGCFHTKIGFKFAWTAPFKNQYLTFNTCSRL